MAHTVVQLLARCYAFFFKEKDTCLHLHLATLKSDCISQQ